jgi:hypothetical protein
MYYGFEEENLSNSVAVRRAIDHIGQLYWATARGIQKKDRRVSLPESPYYHPDILRIQMDLKRTTQKPNEYKQGGYLSFWVRKLKPFRHYEIFGGTYTNEFLGLHFGLATVSVAHPGIAKKVLKNQRLWNEWLYDLRYRPVSGHELAKQFEMLAL